jgi:hypothetical protein
MAERLKIAEGERFGKLTAVRELPKERGMRTWLLRCDCGTEFSALQKTFTSGGKRRSCGCDCRKEISHGLSKCPEYRHWINMISRCENPNTPGFEHYGGRGIKVCERWRSDFTAFYQDMGVRPSPSHSLDRVDVNGHYEPGNCRWALKKIQCRNTRKNRIVKVKGWNVTLAEAAERAPVPYNTILYRLKRGWKIEDAISRPAHKGVRP